MPSEFQDIRKLDVNFSSPAITGPMDWYDASSLTVEGMGWPNVGELAFCRLPEKAKAVVPEMLWYLSRHSSGVVVRFVTDATQIAAQWELRYSPWTAPHMAATASSSFDLYLRDGARWRFAGIVRPPRTPEDPAKPDQIIGVLAKDLTPGRREYLTHFPLYNGVRSLRLGVSAGSKLTAALPRKPIGVKPICFYGGSVLQGAVASRPGMSYPAMLARRLDRPFLNLGFSGNGKVLVPIAQLLAELDPSIFLIDPVGNNTAQELKNGTEPFIRTIRSARPKTPIVMVAGRSWQQAHHVQDLHDKVTSANTAWRTAYDRLAAAGVNDLHYVFSDDMLGHDNDATVDGIHATDLGFFRITDVLEPVLRPLV